MRRVIAISYVMAILCVLQAGRASAEDARIVLKGLDPVSLVEGREERGKERFGSSRGGFRYLFVDAEHKARFDEEPGRFAVRGDKCTVMPKAPASPDLFLVHEGKIFLFGSPRCLASFKVDPAKYLDVTPRKNVAIFLYDGVELLDFAGPGEVFAVAGEGRAFNVFTVGAASGTVESQGFVAVTPQYTFADCPKVDVLVLPGGATRIPLADPSVVEWIRKTSGDAEVSLSVCTGAFLLAKAGLLDGLDATTHRSSLDALKAASPKTRVLEGRRFVDCGKVVTSAG
ncbi:DJ-1/PfpI family protein, partial [Singulisphaera rosea]